MGRWFTILDGLNLGCPVFLARREHWRSQAGGQPFPTGLFLRVPYSRVFREWGVGSAFDFSFFLALFFFLLPHARIETVSIPCRRGFRFGLRDNRRKPEAKPGGW